MSVRVLLWLLAVSAGLSLAVFAVAHAGVLVILAAGAGGFALLRRRTGG